MAQYTPHRNLPYPEGSDDVAVHQDVQALAVKTDTELHMLKHEATRLAYEAADAAAPPRIPVNLVDMSQATLGNMSSSGAVYDHSANSVTPFIPVEPGTRYVLFAESLTRVVFFDANQRNITSTDTTLKAGNETHHWVAPDDAAYVRIGVTYEGVYYQDALVIFNRGDTVVDPGNPHNYPPSGYWEGRELPPISGSGSVDEAQVRRIVESFIPQWEPSFPTLQFETIYTGWVEPYWLSEDGEMLYGREGHIVVQSSDEWETHQTVYEIENGRGLSAIRTLDNGELLISTGRNASEGVKAKLFRSFGYDRENPAAATWTEVLEAGATEASINNSWGLHVYQNVVIAGEYGLRGVEGARRVWMSEDYGENWDLVFDQMLDTQNIEGAPTWTDSAHIHTAAWDPYWSRIWVVVGDNPNTATYYSDDKGVTWTYVEGSGGPPPAMQYTGIMPLADAVIFGSDRSPNGVHVYYRGQKSEMPVIEPLLLLDDNPNIAAVFQMPYKQDWHPTTPTYFAATGAAGAAPTVIIGFVDGKKAHVLWTGEHPDTEAPMSGMIRWALGPTAQGNIIAPMWGDPTVTGTRVMKAPAPTWARA